MLQDNEACPLRWRQTHFVRTAEESKRLNAIEERAIIISASGMCEGGRIVHHLKQRLPHAQNTVLLVGYQEEGTRGYALATGSTALRIHGEQVPVRARIASIEGLSAHADYGDTLQWLAGFQPPPRRTFIVHGRPEASQALAEKIKSRLGWTVELPEYLSRFELG